MSQDTPSPDQPENDLPAPAGEPKEPAASMENPSSVEPPAMSSSGETPGQMIDRMISQISKVVVGMEEPLEHVLAALLAQGHVLLEGVPGLGKTLLVKALAKTIGGQFRRIQFTPDLMPTDVMGHAIYNMKTEKFNIKKGPVFTNLLLADEINRTPAKTQAAMLEVMQEQQVTIEGRAYKVALPFMVLATQNPVEQEGTYPLPEAQLDRFLMKVKIEYPSHEDEQKIITDTTDVLSHRELDVDHLEEVMSAESLLKLQEMANKIHSDEAVTGYAVSIIRQTRENHHLSLGAGTRAGIALIRCAKSMALMSGRDYVTPDDIKSMAIPVLRHRIALTPEAEIEGLTNDGVLMELIDTIKAPRV